MTSGELLEELNWFSFFLSFVVTDVPALVWCHCRYGATSPASKILENEKSQGLVHGLWVSV